MSEKLKKWRLILGKQSDPEGDIPLDEMQTGVDNVLEALYDAERKGGLGSSAPNINRWLGDIRKYFPASVVQLMQKDAYERLELNQMLMEPELLESIIPDVHLVSVLLSLKKVMPDHTRETARLVVKKVVEDLEKKLDHPMRQAIQGSINKAVRNRRPKHNEIDWHKTIRLNLKHYQKDLKTIIPEQLIGYGKKGQALRNVILLIDQSGSMATSLVYASVFGAVMASIRSVKTNVVVFDTAVVDLSEYLDDPVELLFATQLGGGTDINKALKYTRQLIQNPGETILVLISDLYEGGNEQEMMKTIASLKAAGVQLISLLALNDKGAPVYDKDNAAKLAAMDIPVFACTPDQFPPLMAAAIKKENLSLKLRTT